MGPALLPSTPHRSRRDNEIPRFFSSWIKRLKRRKKNSAVGAQTQPRRIAEPKTAAPTQVATADDSADSS